MSSRTVLAAQGGYYIATGLWAIAHRRSFEAVSGKKVDYWLVRTVGALTVAIGGALGIASRRPEPSEESVVLSAGSVIAFGVVDAVYASPGRIRRIYLLDLAAQLALLGALASTMQASRRAASGSTEVRSEPGNV